MTLFPVQTPVVYDYPFNLIFYRNQKKRQRDDGYLKPVSPPDALPDIDPRPDSDYTEAYSHRPNPPNLSTQPQVHVSAPNSRSRVSQDSGSECHIYVELDEVTCASGETSIYQVNEATSSSRATKTGEYTTLTFNTTT